MNLSGLWQKICDLLLKLINCEITLVNDAVFVSQKYVDDVVQIAAVDSCIKDNKRRVNRHLWRNWPHDDWWIHLVNVITLKKKKEKPQEETGVRTGVLLIPGASRKQNC